MRGPEGRVPRDTTPGLEGRPASVVAIFSSVWGENQALSFVAPSANPELHEALEESGKEGGAGGAQLVRLNIETNRLRAWLVSLFKGSLRRKLGPDAWDKYYVVRNEVPDSIREACGLLNSKVGYVYLLDSRCRIRWAASGLAEPEERASLARGVRRLLAEHAAEEAAAKGGKAAAKMGSPAAAAANPGA
jgi:mitochondrial ATPase complex subunit ATP10